jgi:hypothetical protein
MDNTTTKFNFTKETAMNCPKYKDSNINGCMFSPTFKQYGIESKAGIWCMRCFISNNKND